MIGHKQKDAKKHTFVHVDCLSDDLKGSIKALDDIAGMQDLESSDIEIVEKWFSGGADEHADEKELTVADLTETHDIQVDQEDAATDMQVDHLYSTQSEPHSIINAKIDAQELLGDADPNHEADTGDLMEIESNVKDAGNESSDSNDEDPLEFAIEYSKSSRKCYSNDCEDKIKKVMSKTYTGRCHDWTQAKRCQEAHFCPFRLPI
jgi:hypothetical protein